MKPENEELLKKYIGDPLPELDPIYNEGIQFFAPYTVEEDNVPYIMKMLFTPDEMKMVVALPGSIAEVAQKTGFDEAYVGESLTSLMFKGRVLPTDEGFGRLPVPFLMPFLDFTYFTLEGNPENYTDELLNTLMLGTLSMRNTSEVPEEIRFKIPNRVIPKWNAIKNIPGVMDCENVKSILMENQEKGEICETRCICNVMSTLRDEGTYPGSKKDHPDYICEGCDISGGHCYQFGPMAKQYFIGVLNNYSPDKEETLKKLEETEAANVIYTVGNQREVSNLCCCNFDYCVPRYYALWDWAPSRFQVYRKEDKCKSCGKCSETCQFKAIDRETYRINPDICMGCGNCVTRCENKALKLKIVRPADWIPEVPQVM